MNNSRITFISMVTSFNQINGIRVNLALYIVFQISSCLLKECQWGLKRLYSAMFIVTHGDQNSVELSLIMLCLVVLHNKHIPMLNCVN